MSALGSSNNGVRTAPATKPCLVRRQQERSPQAVPVVRLRRRAGHVNPRSLTRRPSKLRRAGRYPSQNLRNQDKDHADTHGSIGQFGDDRSQQQQRDNGDQGVASAKSVLRVAELAEN